MPRESPCSSPSWASSSLVTAVGGNAGNLSCPSVVPRARWPLPLSTAAWHPFLAGPAGRCVAVTGLRPPRRAAVVRVVGVAVAGPVTRSRPVTGFPAVTGRRTVSGVLLGAGSRPVAGVLVVAVLRPVGGLRGGLARPVRRLRAGLARAVRRLRAGRVTTLARRLGAHGPRLDRDGPAGVTGLEGPAGAAGRGVGPLRAGLAGTIRRLRAGLAR